jgi:hypothetical protein
LYTAATQPLTWGITAAIPPRYRQTGTHDADGAMGSSTVKGSLAGQQLHRCIAAAAAAAAAAARARLSTHEVRTCGGRSIVIE